MGALAALVWSNIRRRARRPLLLLVEILLPSLLLLFVVHLKQFHPNRKHGEELFSPVPLTVEGLENARMLIDQLKHRLHRYGQNFTHFVAVAPASDPLTIEIANRLKAKLDAHNITVPLWKLYQSEADVLDDYQRHPEDMVGAIINDGVSSDGVFTYRVRGPLGWVERTDEKNKFKANQQDNPGSSTYVDNGFTLLQSMINDAFVRISTNHTGPFPISMASNQIPYPARVVNGFRMFANLLIPACVGLGTLPSIITLIVRYVGEKETRIQSLLSTGGVCRSTHRLSLLAVCALTSVPSCLLASLLMHFSDLLPNSNVLFLFLACYVFQLGAFNLGLLLAAGCRTAQVAGSVSSALLFALYFPTFILAMAHEELSAEIKIAWALLPCEGFMLICRAVNDWEAKGPGVILSNMFQHANEDAGVAPAVLLLAMAAGALAFYWLGLAAESVFADGLSAVANPVLQFKHYIFNVFLNRTPSSGYSKLSTESDDSSIEMIGASQIDCSDRDGYEPPLPNTVPGLTARNLCKRFGDRQAVDGLSFDLPLGQITTLLGHNGAGKTTTISMLMGFLTPDSGTVDWGDTHEDEKEVRVGVCFQENVLYDDLSVDEHLRLMGRLRLPHLNSAELEKEVSTTANCFGLAGQKQSLARNLSGGNKRRLCVALAMIGGPRLVILDEPTAGMDVCARRSLWAELHNNKEGRAILMTTHLMDEADSIGDRITILSHGKLRAMGSPMFLKAKFANGLFLNLLKCQRYDRDAVHRLVQNHVPHCQVVRDTAVDVEFLLPGTHLKYLTGLVEQLEEGKTNLGIASFGVSLPTMDNVFINLADTSQLDKQQQNQKAKRVASSSHRDGGFAIGSDDESESTTHLPRDFAPIGTRLSGIRLVLAQLRLLLLKRFVGSVRNWKGWLIQLGVPAAITCCVLLASHLFPIVTNPPPQILDTSYFRSPNIIPYQFKNSSYSAYKEAEMLQMLRQVASPVDTFVPMPADIDPNRYLADTILVRWRNQFAAITTDDDIYSNRMQLTVWWDSHAYHGPPAYFNMAWNLLLQMMSPERQYRIVTINQPLPPTPAQQQQEVRLRGQDTLAAMALVAALALALSPPLTASVKERVSGARHQQVIAGASPRLLLLSDVIVDLTSYTVAACLTALTLMIGKSSFASSTNLPALFVLFALYGLAAHPQNYLVCRNLTNPSMVHVVVLGVASATGLLPAIGHFLISSAIGEDGSRANWMGFNLNIMGAEKRDDVIHLQKLFETLWLVSPSFCVGHGLVRLSKAQLEADVKRVFDPTVDRVGPWEWELLGRVLLALAVQVCLWYPIAFFVDGRINGMTSQSWMQWLCGLCRRSGNSQKRKVSLQGFGVQDEHQRVTSGEAIREGDQLVANELMKSYPTRGTVLSGVTFSVRSGECFGLLGPNGAGKTTTFNILTGLLRADGGEAFLGGFSTTKYPERARLMVGYCPQHDALLDFMTGREGLSLQAGLRGLHGQGAVTAVNEAIGLLQLQAIADRPMREYSGGNKRKISTAMALIGLPPVLLLDEPTAGLDPQARQFLREVVIGAKSRGQAVVMTSHSMQEARLLCDRMMFLAGGSLRCIGAPQQLTNEFCTGFITTIKPGADSNIFELTKQLRALFHPHQCSIAEQNADLIRLTISTREESRDTFINNSMTSQTCTAQLTLSTVLLSLESLRAQFPNMEYSVSETTLEQLFLRLVEMTSDVDSHGPQQTA